jgi:hypothetical protein
VKSSAGEREADLLMQQAGDHQRHDLLLTIPQGSVAFSQRAHLQLARERNSAALEGLLDGIQDSVVAEGLGQEFDGSIALTVIGTSPNPHDEDDRHLAPLGGDESLQIHPVRVRKTAIQHQAIRNKCARAGEELLCRSEVSGFQPADPLRTGFMITC